MKTLDRKLLRDLRRLWSQALTIALVVASGIGGFITSLSAVDSLALARDRFYATGHFADMFVGMKRAPRALAAVLAEVPGVADVQTTVEQIVRIELPGSADPIVGRLIGLDPRHPPRLNRVTLAGGSFPGGAGTRSDGALEALVSEAFAQAHGLRPGATFHALVNGRRNTLVMVGTALSPEFIFAGLWGMPDQRGFGIFWIDQDTLAAAYDMEGAFNQAALKLAPGASEEAVSDAVARLVSPFGGREALGRAQQSSHAMLDNEIKEQHVMGTLLPAIFLGVAAFLLNVVVSRLVSTQREQIATLKALGYPDLSIGLHYLKLVLLIVLAGLVLGVGMGDVLGGLLTRLYAGLFHFPVFEHAIPARLVVLGAGVAVLTAVAGTLQAILATVRLPPAEAMRPPAPGRYRRTLLERLGVRRIAPALRMILRNMERRALRTVLTTGSVAAAVAIVIMGSFFRDAIDLVVDTQFTLSLRGDVTLWTTEAVDEGVRRELARLPGVTGVESLRFVAVNFVHGHRRERSMIRGYAARPVLYRVIDMAQQETLLEGRGLVLTDRLAHKLDLRPGDMVRIEILEGRERTLEVPLSGTVREMMGLNAYMDRRELNRLLGEGDVATGFVLAVERGAHDRVLEASKALPRAAGAWSKATMLRNMQEISARNVRIMSTILNVFACIIAVGVVYNNARIALAERAWELASLRVLGFSRAEVSGLLLGELAIVIVVALPLGMVLGWGLAELITRLLQSDLFAFPVVIRARTYAWSALWVLAAGTASALVVRRRIDRLDLVAALKTRD